MSRTTGHRWLERYRAEQGAGLLDRSRRPLSSPLQTPQDVVGRVLEAKSRYPPSPRRKPENVPSPFDFPDGPDVRRTDARGVFSFSGSAYKTGRALGCTKVAVCREDVYCGRANLGALDKYAL